MRCWSVALVAIALSSAACSSSSSSAPSGSPQAVAMCNKVVDAACTAMDRCGYSKKADCVSGAASSLPCGKAVSTTTNAQPCVDTLATIDCASLGTASAPVLPAVCKGVILFPAGASFGAHAEPGVVAPHFQQLASPVDGE